MSGYADIVMVLDDGSTDGTAWAAADAGARLIQHKENRGYGAAIKSILSVVRNSDFYPDDVLVILDSDNQHDPADIPSLVKVVREGYDLVVGKRASSDVPFYRRIGGTLLSVVAWMVSGVWVADSQSGFRAYSQKAVLSLDPREDGMVVGSEVLIQAARNGLRIREVPISVRYLDDSSTLNPWKHGLQILWRISVMVIRMAISRRQVK